MYSKTPITCANYNIPKPGEEPAIFVLGTLDPRVPLPSTRPDFSTTRFLGHGATFGTLVLSSDIFLRGRLLPLLEGINRATTLLPAHLDMDASNWIIELTTWKEKFKNGPARLANWNELPKTDSSFE